MSASAVASKATAEIAATKAATVIKTEAMAAAATVINLCYFIIFIYHILLHNNNSQ